MTHSGGCFCGAIRYEVTGKPMLKAQCHCRACQHFTGGAPNLFMVLPKDGFCYTRGSPSTYQRPDHRARVAREFCGACGTQLTSLRPRLDAVILKIGTLDDPSAYKAPRMSIYVAEAQAFHHIPDDLPAFDGYPQMG